MAKPEKVFKVGLCQAAVFRNEVEKNGKTITMPKVVLQARFKDRESNEWENTNSLGVNDIPKGVLALQQAYEYLTAKGGSALITQEE